MARKKETEGTLSAEESSQIQRLITQFHSIVEQIRASRSPEEAEAALAEITNAPQNVQSAFIKALATVNETDAADLLQAIYTYHPDKESRKEARRSLIRLEGARVYPEWHAPTTPTVAPLTPNPPRFWKGEVTEVREQGEIQLFLYWEQGLEYGEARVLGFLLDFWRDGVKDFFMETGGKRRIETRVNEITAKYENVKTTDCTLAEGRRLLQEALSVNEWRRTTPAEDYRRNLPIIRQFVLESSEPSEDRGRTFIDPALEPLEVAVNFIGAWSMGDYGLAYDLLSDASPVRENLTRDEWIERRRAWADEAHPANLELSFAQEREQAQSALWVPTPTLGGRGGGRKEVSCGWSLELSETPLSGTLKEMAMGTAVDKETGRHWFWTVYTLTQIANSWRIQQVRDEGAAVQGLPIEELQRRIKEQDDRIEQIMQQQQELRARGGSLLNEPDPQKLLEEISRRMSEAMHYDDALMVRLPLDQKVVESAYSHAISVNNQERAAVYLQRMAQRFPERRADVLRELAMTQNGLAEDFARRGLKERSERFQDLAEQSLRESLNVRETALGYILLAQLRLSRGRGSEEAQKEATELLERARSLHPAPPEETIIEAIMGDMAGSRREFEAALRHYQRAAEIRPDYPAIWDGIGHTQRELNRLDEARSSFERALQQNPADLRAYGELTDLYMQQKQFTEARELLEQGLRRFPDSAHLRALLSSVYLDSGDLRQARHYLEEAEKFDPELPSVAAMRQLLSQVGQGRKR